MNPFFYIKLNAFSYISMMKWILQYVTKEIQVLTFKIIQLDLQAKRFQIK